MIQFSLWLLFSLDCFISTSIYIYIYIYIIYCTINLIIYNVTSRHRHALDIGFLHTDLILITCHGIIPQALPLSLHDKPESISVFFLLVSFFSFLFFFSSREQSGKFLFIFRVRFLKHTRESYLSRFIAELCLCCLIKNLSPSFGGKSSLVSLFFCSFLSQTHQTSSNI